MIRAEKERKEQMRNQMSNQNMSSQGVNEHPNTGPPASNLNQNPMFQNRPNDNFQNSFHPVTSNQGIPSQSPPQQPVITKSEDVNDILKRLHTNERYRRRISVNNDRKLSDTTVSEGGTRRRKKNL